MWSRMRETMRARIHVHEAGAPGNRTLTFPGVTAGIRPGTPERSVLNSVVYDDAAALAAAYDWLAAAYRDAGVRAWTVWVPERDSAAAELLSRTGHKLDAAPAAMAL